MEEAPMTALRHPPLDMAKLALHWGHDKISALHGGARVTRRPLRDRLNEALPAFLIGLAAVAGLALLWLLKVPG